MCIRDSLYEEKKCFGLDYNDLIFFTLYIFEREREIRRKWQDVYKRQPRYSGASAACSRLEPWP